jgi:hypothetical protein
VLFAEVSDVKLAIDDRQKWIVVFGHAILQIIRGVGHDYQIALHTITQNWIGSFNAVSRTKNGPGDAPWAVTLRKSE